MSALKFKYAVAGIVFSIAVLICAVWPAHAQLSYVSNIKELPSYLNEMKEEDFMLKTNEIEEKPKGDRYLAFHVRLPKNWIRSGGKAEENAVTSETSGIKLSRRILGRVIKYYSVPSSLIPPSRFEIQALNLDRQITAKNWFLGYALTNGYTLQGMKVIDNDRIEAQYVLIDNAVSYVVRTIAIINGPRMVLISYFVPENQWPKERAMQEYVLKSFEFFNKEQSNLEVTRTFAFLDLLRFDYPASWRLVSPNLASIETMDAKLIKAKDNQSLIGEISLRIISTELETSLPQEINYLKANIHSMGLDVGDLIETINTFKYKPQVNFARVEVYKAVANDSNANLREHEYWLAIMAEDRYYYIVTMITPSRATDFYNWAQNIESFQMVVETLRP